MNNFDKNELKLKNFFNSKDYRYFNKLDFILKCLK